MNLIKLFLVIFRIVAFIYILIIFLNVVPDTGWASESSKARVPKISINFRPCNRRYPSIADREETKNRGLRFFSGKPFLLRKNYKGHHTFRWG